MADEPPEKNYTATILFTLFWISLLLGGEQVIARLARGPALTWFGIACIFVFSFFCFVFSIKWERIKSKIADLWPLRRLKIAEAELARVLVENEKLRKRLSEPLQVAATPSPSKLKIIAANWAARSGQGPTLDVLPCLEGIKTSDSLVIDDLANHSFHYGGHDYGGEPKFGHKKRLQVTYSFNGRPPCTIDRTEGFRIVLPEEKEELFCSLQMEAFILAKELRDFYAGLDPYPEITPQRPDEPNSDWLVRHTESKRLEGKWVQKMSHGYLNRAFGQRIATLVHRAGEELELELPLGLLSNAAEIGVPCNPDSLPRLAQEMEMVAIWINRKQRGEENLIG